MSIDKVLQDLPQYHFSRSDFCLAFDWAVPEIYRSDLLSEYDVSTDSFHFHRNGDEFYLIHYNSGTIVNWYKHLGRTNTCNNTKLNTTEDLMYFFNMYFNEWYDLRKPIKRTESNTPGPDVNSMYPKLIKLQLNSVYGYLNFKNKI